MEGRVSGEKGRRQWWWQQARTVVPRGAPLGSGSDSDATPGKAVNASGMYTQPRPADDAKKARAAQASIDARRSASSAPLNPGLAASSSASPSVRNEAVEEGSGRGAARRAARDWREETAAASSACATKGRSSAAGSVTAA